MVLNAQAATHERVQLWAGGPYWATTNIGADKPEDYGLYFWWGDTTGHRPDYNFISRNSAIYTYNKSVSELQSAGWVTSSGVLAPSHDAAHVKWGGAWRMPTKQEFDGLNNNCDWTWTTQNGVNGYAVRGRGAYASNSIFLPAAGHCDGTSLDASGSYGICWSSVPYSGNNSRAYALGFGSDYHLTSYGGNRGHGRSVRPVIDSAERALSEPTGVAAVTYEGLPQAVKISWNAVSEATSYRVEYSIDNQSFSALPNCGSLSGTEVNFEWNLSNATMELPRYYRVIA